MLRKPYISVSQPKLCTEDRGGKQTYNMSFFPSAHLEYYIKNQWQNSAAFSTKTLVHHLKFELTIVNCPHDPESRTTNLIERFSASNYFPKNNTPTEYITFFTVIATWKGSFINVFFKKNICSIANKIIGVVLIIIKY